MPYAAYARQFVDEDGVPLDGVQVPESCINSTEYIMRAIKHNSVRQLRRRDSMFATFMNRAGTEQVTFNASTDDVLEYVGQGYLDFPFGGLPQVGQGIALLRQSAEAYGDYEMHFGAVLARNDDEIVVSNMMALVANEQMRNLQVVTIRSVRDFARAFGRGARNFAAGLVTMP